MPDSKVSSLTSASVAASNDAVYLVRDPQGAPLSRRVTLDTLLNSSLVYTGASITTSQLVVKDGPASINNQLSVGKVLSSSRNAVELAPWGTEGSATGELRLLEGTGGSNYVALKSPSAVLNDYVIRLPDHVGTSGQLLATYGNGACGLNTYWATVNPGTIGTDTPADIGSSGTAGGASISGAQNHVHRGVLSFGASGTNVPMYGGVYATEGLNISLSQSNTSVTFATLTCPTFGQLSVTGPTSITGNLTATSILASQLVIQDSSASITPQLSVGRIISSSKAAVELAPFGTEGSAAAEIRFLESPGAGSNLVALKAPSAILNNITFRLPDHSGTSGQVLATLGNSASGDNLYWATKTDAAPVAASYLTLSVEGQLSAERVLTAGCGIQFEDSGANGKLTVSYNPLHSQIFS